jgi:hypothetical protein
MHGLDSCCEERDTDSHTANEWCVSPVCSFPGNGDSSRMSPSAQNYDDELMRYNMAMIMDANNNQILTRLWLIMNNTDYPDSLLRTNYEY